jgi:hypothetical protein
VFAAHRNKSAFRRAPRRARGEAATTAHTDRDTAYPTSAATSSAAGGTLRTPTTPRGDARGYGSMWEGGRGCRRRGTRSRIPITCALVRTLNRDCTRTLPRRRYPRPTDRARIPKARAYFFAATVVDPLPAGRATTEGFPSEIYAFPVRSRELIVFSIAFPMT